MRFSSAVVTRIVPVLSPYAPMHRAVLLLRSICVLLVHSPQHCFTCGYAHVLVVYAVTQYPVLVVYAVLQSPVLVYVHTYAVGRLQC